METKLFSFYRLFNLNYDECYIGSTTNYKQRMIRHKTTCNKPNSRHHNLKVYNFIRDNGGFKNWKFEILDEQVLNKKEALEIESEFIMIYDASLNIVVPGRTKKDYNNNYRINNKEQIKERKKQYYLINKEQINERNKKYKLNNKEKYIEQRKQYYINNKEKIIEQQRQRRLKNKPHLKL
tara:strand:+ start:445 stop:984 length:540 start_codon:yes stop_codon:yes gene_type:complete